jgi:hypothetical protein
MKKIILLILSCHVVDIFFNQPFAQVAINTTNAIPNSSAMLDITSTSKGLLIPRMTTAQRNSIVSPSKGLLVFDNTSNTFWYYNGSMWQEIIIANNVWSLTGNTSTNAATNFIGTTDNQNFRFKRNNLYAGEIDTINTTFGLSAGNITVSSGKFNSDFGVKALSSNTTGINNTATGYQSLKNNTSGTYNTANGSYSLLNNATGINNTAFGSQALYSNTTASNNTAVGLNAMYSNTTGDFNTAVGSGGLFANTTGSSNTAIGLKAMNLNTTGSFNTGYGAKSLINNSTGGGNTAVGANSLISNTTGNNNTATGTNALFLSTTGVSNTATGTNALFNNTTGMENVATGESSLAANSIGNDNTAIGIHSLYQNTTGNANVGIGTLTLLSNISGVANTAIGAGADVGAGDLVNATAIGSDSKVACSNCMVLGSVDIVTQLPQVNVGIGTTNPAFVLDVAGRMRIRSGAGINTAGAWFNNNANTNVAAFTGMYSDSYVGFYGTGSGWGFLMNTQDGRVSIGSAAPANGYKLSVSGKAICEELVVQLQSAWPDYVFKKNYQLPPLNELEKFISVNKHLPNIPVGANIEKNGLEVGEMEKRMMEKIEELTLYVIELNKKIKNLEEQNNAVKNK